MGWIPGHAVTTLGRSQDDGPDSRSSEKRRTPRKDCKIALIPVQCGPGNWSNTKTRENALKSLSKHSKMLKNAQKTPSFCMY